jgi:DUF2892 family protein
MIWINEPLWNRFRVARGDGGRPGGGREGKDTAMSIDRAVMAFAGFLVLLSLVLSQVHSPHWLWLTALVGANLLQASFTGFCPAAMLFKRLGLGREAAFS